jgi:uncharacterized protein with HEPN domain
MRLDRERLEDMLEAIEAIERYMPADKQDFDANELVRVWCLRHIEIIGEAAANISDERRTLAADIPWRQVVGMRNTLIHAYFDVDWNEVWAVVSRDLQPLKAGVRALLGKIEGEEP